MKANEARDAGTAAGTGLRSVTRVVRGIHGAISDGVYIAVGALVGPAARPVKVAQDVLTSGVYAVTGLGLEAGGRVAGAYAAYRLAADGDTRPSVHDGSAAHRSIAIGTGLLGESVWRHAASMAPSMQVRHGGHAVELTPAGLAAAYGEVTSDLVVFVHGLVETEAAWGYGAKTRATYADRLHADLGLTPVMVRYNTGLRISENGLLLSALLADVVQAWPVPARRVVLIGHSMGGLVIHSALASLEDRPAPAWLPLVTETVTLGSPHHGSPLARSAFRATEALARNERTRFAADILRLRSAGVRDLAFGNIVAADWEGHHPDDHLDRRTHPVPADGIRHHAVAAVATRHLPAPVAEVIGDLLVPVASASHSELGEVTRRFTHDGVAVVCGVTHLGLLNNDATYEHLYRWLAKPAPPS